MTLLGHARGAGSRRTLVQRFAGIRWARRWARCGTVSILRVHDSVALDEIDLYAEVLGAVAASDRPLTPEELDEVLGATSVA